MSQLEKKRTKLVERIKFLEDEMSLSLTKKTSNVKEINIPEQINKIYHYLYKTTNMINGKYYIGVHSTYKIKDGYLGSGTKLWNSIYKYGKENFIKEELEFFETREDLLQREKEVVNEKCLQDPLCMNLKEGGNGGATPEMIKKWSLSGNVSKKEKLKDPIYFEKYSKIRSKIASKNFSEGKLTGLNWTDKKHSNETLIKMSNSHKGKNNSQYGTCWINKNGKNKKIKKEELIPWLNKKWKKGRIN